MISHSSRTLQAVQQQGQRAVHFSGLGLDDVHTPRGLSHSMPSDDSQLDALEHTVDVAAVQNSLAHMSMPHGGIKNSRRPQANSPGGCMHHTHPDEAIQLLKQLTWLTKRPSATAIASCWFIAAVQNAHFEHTLSSAAEDPVWLTLCLARVGQPVYMR